MKSLSLVPKNLERLFLFEIYVESLKIDYPKLCLTQTCLDNLKEITIQFRFLGFNTVEIKEGEFAKASAQSPGEKIILAGKSCLFSIRDLPKEVSCFEVGITVMRRIESGGCLTLGVTSIKLGENFAKILKASIPNKSSSSVKKCLPLFDKYNKVIGKIILSLNLSCFGKMITTSFQLDGEDSKAYVVQPGGEVPIADFLSNCEISERGTHPEEQAFSRLLGGAGYQQGGGMIQTYRAEYSGGLLGGTPIHGGMSNFAKQTAPCTKVPICKDSSSSSSEDSLPPCPPPMPHLEFCNCDYPLPPGFMQPPLPKKKKKKKKKNAGCLLGNIKDFCLNPGCPMGYPSLPEKEEKHRVCQAMPMPPGTIGLKGEQVMVQLPSDNQPIPGNKRATYNFGGGLDDNLNEVKILTENQKGKHATPDARTDIYVMKVGKTNQETDLRHRMVLELKQPKLYNEEKILTDIRTQYLMTDFTPEAPKKEGGGKKGKKKKGKGKKGKKKGKKKK